MADLSITPELFPSMLVPPPRSSAASSNARPAAPGDRLELSPEAQDQLNDLQLRDAILLKMAMEGKDFHAARQEVLAGKAAETRSSSPEREAPAGSSLKVEATSVRVIHVEGEVTTPNGRLEFEATRIDFSRVGFSSQKQDPLVLDLDGAGPRTTGQDGARAFDLQGDGRVAPTSFVSGNSAFLALDRDGNGRIDSGQELFGDQHGARDGYEELRKFDSDQNGRIDVQDPVYGELRLLFGDQRQLALSAAGIAAIGLDARQAGWTTEAGDDVLRSATAETADGRTLRSYAMGLQRFEATG